MNLYKHLKDLENLVNKQTSKQNTYVKATEDIEEKIRNKEKEEKKLREEYYTLQKMMRNLTPEQQVYISMNKFASEETDSETGVDTGRSSGSGMSLRKIIRQMK